MSARANKSPDWHRELDIDKVHMLNACRDGHIDRVCELLDGTPNGSPAVDIDEGDDDATTALQIAAAKGNIDLVDILINKYQAQVNLSNELGFTPFLHACREGHLDVAARLKEYGADETRKTKFGVSALGLAAAGGHCEVINFLLSLNLNINSKETNLTPTPLMACAARSRIEAAHCLESRGANVNYISPPLGLSAILMALISGSENMLDTIIEIGARLEDATLCKKDALTIAESAGNIEAIRYIRRRQNEKNGAERIKYPRTQIVDIIDQCDEKELRQLQLRDRQSNGITPIMYAVLLNRPKAIQFFNDTESQFNQSNFVTELNAQEPELKLTALIMAIVIGDLDMVEMLLNFGADPNLEARIRKDDESFTAFDLALFCQFNEASKLLFQHKYADSHTTKHHTKDSKSPRKEIINKFLHRFGLSDSEFSGNQIVYRSREAFDSLVNSSFIDWAESLPFVTADQLLAMNRKPTQIQNQPTVEDRLSLVRNMAKAIIDKQGYLKPFPVGFPLNNDFRRLENFLTSVNDIKSNFDEYKNWPPSVEQNYQEMKEANSKTMSRSNSRVISDRGSWAEHLALGSGTDNDYRLNLYHLNRRSEIPNRRQSENSHIRNQLPTPQNWSNSDATPTAYIHGLDSSPYYLRNQSPLLTSTNPNNPRSSRQFPIYSSSSAKSMPNSPAIHSTSQRRYGPNTPTHSPKSSNLNLTRIRQRVPHNDLLGVSRFDPHYTSSAPSTPQTTNVNPMLELSKTFPSSQSLTMTDIENHLKKLQLGAYYTSFIQQEIDNPTVFLQLTPTDVQLIVQNEKVADNISNLIKQLRCEYGVGIESL